MKEIEFNLSVPATLIKDGPYFVIATTNESSKLLGNIVVQGDTKEDAEKEFWKSVKIERNWLEESRLGLECWKPFRKGDWSHIGGTWFSIYGINIFFRYGKNMKHGWYIPGTKLNISITNYWRVKRK